MNKFYCLILSLLAISLWGCTARYEEAAVTPASTASETTTVSETTLEIVIETEPETETEAVPAEPEERIEMDGMIRSYLTGEMLPVGQANRRPLAIMMSNDKESLPQYGINRASIVYEAPVEGEMNRYMAILEEYDGLERMGSVRSCRTYYTYFAREFDAVYAHFGQSSFAKPYLKNVDNINGLEGIGDTAFFRTSDRKRPHNAYSSYARIQESIVKLGYRQEYAPEYLGHYYFALAGHPVELTEPDAVDAYRVVPGYPMNKPWFTYNEDDGQYYRYQYGAEHFGDEGQINVKNIIIQYCQSGFYASTAYLNINVHTPEWGYYITNGKAIPVSWKKDGEFGVTRYYDTQGQEITLNKGKTWVCIVSTKDTAKTEIYGKE